MDIQKIPAVRLNPAAYNPRKDLKPGDREYEKLKRSIVEFGYVEPVIWNRRTGNVVGGHQRLKVLEDMGQTEIDCVVVDLDLRREKALNVALNKIQGDWDEEKLASLMAEFDAADFRPLYRLKIGAPGSSNALLICTRLGLPAPTIAEARGHLSEGPRSFGHTRLAAVASRVAAGGGRPRPAWGFVKRRTPVGTGWAQPTPATTMQMVPKRSKCRSGLRDSRPWLRAVGSPISQLARAWPASWQGMASSVTSSRVR